jgi:hypothetical protein
MDDGAFQTIHPAGVALHSRTVPPERAVTLSFPLEAGTYLVVNGGGDINTNAHLMTLDAAIPRFRPWRGQSYGSMLSS